LKAP